jgi:hypothetical protein
MFLLSKCLHKDAKITKLFTKEDKLFLHKIMGILSIFSYFYRYLFIYYKYGTLGFNGSFFDWITFFIHYSLALTSFFFKIPSKRIEKKPMIIYKEYRLHAIIFTGRCLLVFILDNILPKINRPFYIIPLAVASQHLLADFVTYLYGNGNTAVRTNSKNLKPFYKKISLFYSFYQFLAISSHILPNKHLSDLGWNSLIAIASSAFMMTLYRKRIIKGFGHLFVYSSCLLISMFHIVRLIGLVATFLTLLTFLARIYLPSGLNNKYLCWTLFMIMSRLVGIL